MALPWTIRFNGLFKNFCQVSSLFKQKFPIPESREQTLVPGIGDSKCEPHASGVAFMWKVLDSSNTNI